MAIVVHGGCWVAKLGNMDERAVALDNMRPLAAALTEAGPSGHVAGGSGEASNDERALHQQSADAQRCGQPGWPRISKRRLPCSSRSAELR